jgi:hypothetical protein
MEVVKKDRQQLSCGHVFHAACLAPWSKETNSCPTCRAPILTHLPVKSLRIDTEEEDASLAQEIQDEELMSWLEDRIWARLLQES